MVSDVSVNSRPEAKQVDRATSSPARDRVDSCHARRLFSTIKTSHDACRDPRDCRPPRLCGALCYCRQEEYLIAFCQSGQPLTQPSRPGRLHAHQPQLAFDGHSWNNAGSPFRRHFKAAPPEAPGSPGYGAPGPGPSRRSRPTPATPGRPARSRPPTRRQTGRRWQCILPLPRRDR